MGPLYTLIGTQKRHWKNPENMAVQMPAKTVRDGPGTYGNPSNPLFKQSYETKYAQ